MANGKIYIDVLREAQNLEKEMNKKLQGFRPWVKSFFTNDIDEQKELYDMYSAIRAAEKHFEKLNKKQVIKEVPEEAKDDAALVVKHVRTSVLRELAAQQKTKKQDATEAETKEDITKAKSELTVPDYLQKAAEDELKKRTIFKNLKKDLGQFIKEITHKSTKHTFMGMRLGLVVGVVAFAITAAISFPTAFTFATTALGVTGIAGLGTTATMALGTLAAAATGTVVGATVGQASVVAKATAKLADRQVGSAVEKLNSSVKSVFSIEK
jgi:hypothetical protein